MEWMISAGVTIIGFIWNAAYLKGVFGTKIQEHDGEIHDLQHSVVYRDTCKAHREGADKRLSRCERALNGKLKEVG